MFSLRDKSWRSAPKTLRQERRKCRNFFLYTWRSHTAQLSVLVPKDELEFFLVVSPHQSSRGVSSVPVTFNVTASLHCAVSLPNGSPHPHPGDPLLPHCGCEVSTQEGPHIMPSGALLGAPVTLPPLPAHCKCDSTVHSIPSKRHTWGRDLNVKFPSTSPLRWPPPAEASGQESRFETALESSQAPMWSILLSINQELAFFREKSTWKDETVKWKHCYVKCIVFRSCSLFMNRCWQGLRRPERNIKVPKYLEWVFECSKKHSEEKTSSKKRSTN